MIAWNNLDTLLLDLDGTLLDLHYDNHFWLEHVPRRYAETHALPERPLVRPADVPIALFLQNTRGIPARALGFAQPRNG